MNLEPLLDRVLVRPDTPADRKGRILIPDSAKVPACRGTVLAVGPGRTLDDGTKLPVNCVAGDVVLYAKYASHGTEDYGDLDGLIIVNERDLLCKVV